MKGSGNKPMKHKGAASMKAKEGIKSTFVSKPSEAPRPSKTSRMPERKPS
jgi:hypothetical protein